MPDRILSQKIEETGKQYNEMLFRCREVSSAEFDAFIDKITELSEKENMPSLKFAAARLNFIRKNGIQSINVGGTMGSGKSSMAEVLREKLGFELKDSDLFHPPSNIEKMKNGIPLTDEDRYPFLTGVRDWLKTPGRISTCSALTDYHRSILWDEDKNPNLGLLQIIVTKPYEQALSELDAAAKSGKLRQIDGKPHFIRVTRESEAASKTPLLRNQYELFEKSYPLPWDAIIIEAYDLSTILKISNSLPIRQSQ